MFPMCSSTPLLQVRAKKEGYDNVLYLSADAEGKYLEEVGTSNIFVVKGKTIYTPGVRAEILRPVPSDAFTQP